MASRRDACPAISTFHSAGFEFDFSLFFFALHKVNSLCFGHFFWQHSLWVIVGICWTYVEVGANKQNATFVPSKFVKIKKFVIALNTFSQRRLNVFGGECNLKVFLDFSWLQFKRSFYSI